MTITKTGIFPLANGLTKVILANANMYVELINYGATIYGIYLPSKTTGYENIVLYYDDASDYLTDKFYIGSTIGRVAGRINQGKLPVNDRIYQLTKNANSKHHLHGGYVGFNKKLFEVLIQEDLPHQSITKMRAVSLDGEEGYPGNLELIVTYSLYSDNKLTIEYEAFCDEPTHVNITSHSYFNLCGSLNAALSQQLQINATGMLETDDDYIPTGKKMIVNNSPYDFTEQIAIKNQKEKLTESMFNACYVLSKKNDVDAILYDPISQRKMIVSTSYPSLLFYSGDFLSEPFKPCEGVCLEAQFNPDAANQKGNSSTLLNPGDKYHQHIDLSFSF